ncbi:ubiquitin-specific protease doa4, partial [Gonapodya sp. JEL0774]
MLEGGWDAWMAHMRSTKSSEADWVEKGIDGWGAIGVGGSRGGGRDGLVRSVGDYLSKTPADRTAPANPTPYRPSYDPPAPLRPIQNTVQQPPVALSRPPSTTSPTRKGSSNEPYRGSLKGFDDPFAGFAFDYPSIKAQPRTVSLRAMETMPPALPLSRPPSGSVTPSGQAYIPSAGPVPSSLPRGTDQGPQVSAMPRVPQRAQSFGSVIPGPVPMPAGYPLMGQQGAGGVGGAGYGTAPRAPAPAIPPKPPLYVSPTPPYIPPFAFPPPRASSPGAGGHQQRFFTPISPISLGPGTGGSGRAPAPAVPARPGGGFNPTDSMVADWQLTPSSANFRTTGLKNMGNTCYMNSTLQCLSGTVPLASYFRNGRYRRDLNRSNSLGTRGEVAESFARLVQQLWRGDESYLVPDNLRDAVCVHAPQFRGYEQQDSQEFLAFLMDALHEDLNRGRIGNARVQPMTKREEEEEAKLPVAQQASRAWDRYLRYNDSIIVRDFQGQYGSGLECLSCGH